MGIKQAHISIKYIWHPNSWSVRPDGMLYGRSGQMACFMDGQARWHALWTVRPDGMLYGRSGQMACFMDLVLWGQMACFMDLVLWGQMACFRDLVLWGQMACFMDLVLWGQMACFMDLVCCQHIFGLFCTKKDLQHQYIRVNIRA